MLHHTILVIDCFSLGLSLRPTIDSQTCRDAPQALRVGVEIAGVTPLILYLDRFYG